MQDVQPAASLHNASIAFLRRYPPFDGMEAEVLHYLAAHLSLAYYPSGSVILSPPAGLPQHLYIVQRGLVQRLPAEGYHVGGDVVILGPGECFSVYALMEQRAVASPYSAVADTFCYLLPAAVFTQLLQRSPRFQEFSMHYLRSLLQDSRRLLQMQSASASMEQQSMNRALRDLVRFAPVVCSAATPLHLALRQMQQARVGSIVIINGGNEPVGIFTRYDVLDRVTLAGRALSDTIGSVMTPNPVTLPGHASVHEAALLIATHGVRHVPLTENGRLTGVVTERDLFAVQRVNVRGINRAIAQAGDAQSLVQAGRDVQALARTLYAQGVAAEQLTHLITTLNDALSQRAIAMVRKEHDVQGIRWCWLSFGSEGRQEQTVSTDQDNGLLFAADPQTDAEHVRARLLPFAREVNALLDRCGFPLCRGEIMAGNPQWCLSEGEWRRQFQRWVENTGAQALLNSVIFFDFRALAGDDTLAAPLREFLRDLVRTNLRFLRQLAQYALQVRPPLGLISDFVTEQAADGSSYIDLKKSGARLFVDAARVLALAAGVTETNSALRLRRSGAVLKMNPADVAAAVDAFFFIQQLRLRCQLAGDARDPAKANHIVPATLHEIDRRMLKESLRQSRKLHGRLALDYQL